MTGGKKRRRGKGKPFVKGQSGNPKGRPPGSRQKLSQQFIDALCEDFDAHGVSAIQRMRRFKPEAYVRVVADLVPKNVELDVGDAGRAFLELWKRVGGTDGDAEPETA